MTHRTQLVDKGRRDRPPLRRPREDSDCSGCEWPSPLVEQLAKALYCDWVRSDPSPDDLPWSELNSWERDRYCHMVSATITRYLAQREPEGVQ